MMIDSTFDEGLERLTNEQHALFKRAKFRDIKGSLCEKLNFNEEAYSFKMQAAKLYSSLAKVVSYNSLRKDLFILSGICFDSAGKFASMGCYDEDQHKARLAAAKVFVSIDKPYEAAFSFLWAAEAQLYLENDGEAIYLFRQAEEQHLLAKESDDLISIQYSKMKSFAKELGVLFEI